MRDDRLLKAFLAAALALAAFSCASAPSGGGGPAPAWIGDLEAVYPDARFMAAEGLGDTRRAAEADADAALARRFKVSIKVDAQAMQRYSELVAGNREYSQTERTAMQTVSSSASEQFINLNHAEPWTDRKGQVHSVAFLERDPTAAIYVNLVNKDLAFIQNLRQRAQAAPGRLQAFALLDSALVVGRSCEALLAQLELIRAPRARELQARLDLRALLVERDAVLAEMGYRLDIAGDEDGAVAAMARKALARFNLKERENGALLLRGRLSVAEEPNPKYYSLRWNLELSLLDADGSAVASFLQESRENGLNQTATRGFVFREMDKRVGEQLPRAINDYLARVATGK